MCIRDSGKEQQFSILKDLMHRSDVTEIINACDSGREGALIFLSLIHIFIALGAGLGIWGAINLMEGYGNDNPGARSQGMKQLMAGGGVALIGGTLVPLLSQLFG